MSRTHHHRDHQYKWTHPFWRRECVHKPEKQRARSILKGLLRGIDPEEVYVPDNRRKHFSGYF